MSITEATAAVNGCRLHYAECGAEGGSGKLVLMLHGFPEFWRMWRPVMELVGQHHRAVACDTRGINLSTGPDEVEGYAIGHLVEDVRALIHHLGHETAVLVGHDWGGAIAWQVAIRHPELLERLVIVNCAHPGIFSALLQAGGAQAAASAYISQFRAEGFAEQLAAIDYAPFDALILQPGLAAGTLHDADAEAYRAAWRQPNSVRNGLNYYRAMGGAGAPPDLAQTIVRVPTLVLWGERDIYFVPENVDRLAEVVPDLTLKRFPDNDHWIVQQRPHDIASEILAVC
jgi:pimeloyl-ACP methyl ester carboxylesterase